MLSFGLEWSSPLITFLLCGIGRGINKEGLNFKLATVKTRSTWPHLNKYALSKNFEVGRQTPSSPT